MMRGVLSPDLPRRLRERAPLVTVVGDVMLDGWWRGSARRMTREAPVPVVEVERRDYAPGGAANTAVNLAALGARVRLVSVVGDDDAGRRLRALLAERGVDLAGLLVVPGFRTTAKTRVVGADQVLVRIDELEAAGIDGGLASRVAETAERLAADADAEVVCDYSTGVLGDEVVARLAARRRRPALTVVDAHDPRRWAPVRPTLVTPNADEAGVLLGARLDPEGDRAASVVAGASRILAVSGAREAVVTLDRDGTVLLRAHGEPHRTHAHPSLERQASGAGDTFVAALTIARASGLDAVASAELAQAAADVVVQRFGTSVCGTRDLEEHLGEPGTLVLEAEELAERLEAERRRGRRIVFTNGCFDVLHRGHTTYLHQARRLGDVLVVALNGDDSVRRLKGPGRPVNGEADRAAVLAALGCVDYVTVFDTDTPIPLIERLHPDVYAKGGDYTPEMLEETTVVRSYGGEVRILGYVPAHSTTAVVERIRSLAPAEAKGSS